jgi:intracellular septation protein
MKYSKSMRLGSFFSEILPLASFFIFYRLYGLYAAAIAGVTVSSFMLLYFWLVERRIAKFVVFSTLFSGVLTATAILSSEKLLIKIQPTISSLVMAGVLLGGLLRGKAMMQVFFGTQFRLTEKTWFQLSFRWGLFFLTAAIGNELAWRYLSEENWVIFRTFVMSPATGIFMLSQLPLTLRGRMPLEEDS